MRPVLRPARFALTGLGLVFLLMTAGACATAPHPVVANGNSPTRGKTMTSQKTAAVTEGAKKTATSQPAVDPKDPDQARARKNARIIGEVRAILKAKHSPLPELQKKPTDSREHPRARRSTTPPTG